MYFGMYCPSELPFCHMPGSDQETLPRYILAGDAEYTHYENLHARHIRLKRMREEIDSLDPQHAEYF